MHTQHQARSLLKIEQVSERIQLGRSWIWGAVKRGAFPAPQRLSNRCTRWDSHAIDQWIDRRLTEGSK
jgi:prophage regulatory protein